MDTINKLLKKPAPKRRTRAEIIAAQQADAMATPGAEDGEEEKPDPIFIRYVQGRDSTRRLGVPDEWLEGPLADALAGEKKFASGGDVMGTGRMIEEIS
jgi:Ino eighty subunit 2